MREQILAALIKLRDHRGGYRQGICAFLARELKETCTEELLAAWARWPKASGDPLYPVPSPRLTPEEWYHLTPDKWAGEYGALRRELLDFLIEEFSK
jgi:hypothetical protein